MDGGWYRMLVLTYPIYFPEAVMWPMSWLTYGWRGGIVCENSLFDRSSRGGDVANELADVWMAGWYSV